jgi:hypothetical protein
MPTALRVRTNRVGVKTRVWARGLVNKAYADTCPFTEGHTRPLLALYPHPEGVTTLSQTLSQQPFERIDFQKDRYSTNGCFNERMMLSDSGY